MIGYRAWFIRYTGRDFPGRDFLLFSLFRLGEIPWRREMVAVCERGTLEEDLRTSSHTCGLYSYKSPSLLFEEEVLKEPITKPVAVGAVFNYGIVAEYSEGYRSSHCLIDTIFLPEFSCLYCSSPAEFGWSVGLGGGITLFCLRHYQNWRRKEKEKRILRGKFFPIEAFRIELEKNYQVPVRDIRELMRGR